MDRRTITAVVLLLTLYYGWLWIRGPELRPADGEVAETVEEPASAGVAVAPDHAPAPTDAPARELPFEGCDLRGTWSTDGGALRDAVLVDEEGPLDITPIYTWVMGRVTGAVDGPWHPYGDEVPPERLLGPEAHALVAGSGNPAAAARRYEVVEEGPGALVLRSMGADGVEVTERVFTSSGADPCTLTLEVTWHNRGGRAVPGASLWVGLFDALEPPGGMFAFYKNTERVYARVDEDLVHGAWHDPEQGTLHEPEPVDGERADWVAIADRYHGLFLIPEDRQGAVAWARWGSGEATQDGVIWSPPGDLAPGASHRAAFTVYAGAHDTDVLALVDPTLTDIVDFGMFAVFCYPLLALLRLIEGVTGNWGLAIMLLTVLVRAAFFPLNQSAFRSAEKMKVVQPLLNELREKYKDDAEELNRRTMELFREHKVNPVGGCLPMLIQMPVFLALFYVLMYSVDLYHTDFLYLRDLSSPDPYCALPTVVVGLMMLQQQFTPTGNMDPAQARMMKLMPLMFGVFWYMFPSGLVVYYFVNTALGILQQWWIRRQFAQPAPATAG